MKHIYTPSQYPTELPNPIILDSTWEYLLRIQFPKIQHTWHGNTAWWALLPVWSIYKNRILSVHCKVATDCNIKGSERAGMKLEQNFCISLDTAAGCRQMDKKHSTKKLIMKEFLQSRYKGKKVKKGKSICNALQTPRYSKALRNILSRC